MSLKIDKVQLDIIINTDPARKELRQLDDDLRQTQKELKKLPEGSAEWVKKSEEIKKIQLKMDQVRGSIGLTGMTMKELTQRQRELGFAMNNMNPNLPQYKALRAELQLVQNRMRELRGQAVNTGMSMGKIADGFNRYFAMTASIAASVTGLIFSFRKAVDAFNEFESAVSNLSALTGLTGDDLQWLSDKAKELSISTTDSGVKITSSAQEIVDAFRLMGSAKPELLKDKEALAEVTEQALILAEASKMEVKDAVESLATVMNQFGADASQASKYINVLAAGSKEGAAEVADVAASIVKFGASAAQANISVEESVGLIETLAEKGIKGELAGTGLRNTLLRLQTGADDTNPAIVGVTKAFENLSKKGLNATEMEKMFGRENYTVAQTLTANASRVKFFTDSVKDTSVALEQARVNTNNNATALEQAKNKFQLTTIALGEKLAPALTFSTNAFSYLMKAILAIIDVYKEHRTMINTAIIGIATYGTAVHGLIVLKKTWELTTKAVNIAMQALNTTSKASPWGLVAALITTGAAALWNFYNNQVKITKSTEVLNNVSANYRQSLAEEQAKLEGLFAQLKQTNKVSGERQKIINTINSNYGTTLTNIDNEKEFVKQLDLAYKDLMLSLQKKALLQARESGLVDIESKKLEAQKSLQDLIDLRDQMGFIDAAGNWNLKIGFKTEGAQFLETLTAIKELTPKVDEQLAELDKAKQRLLTFKGKDLDLLNTQGGNGGNNGTASSLTDEEKEAIKKKEEERKKLIEQTIREGKSLGERENDDYIKSLQERGLISKKITEEQRLMLLYGELEDINKSGILKKNATSEELKAVEIIYNKHLDNVAKINTDAYNKELSDREAKYNEEKVIFDNINEQKLIDLDFENEQKRLKKEQERLDEQITEQQFNEDMAQMQSDYQISVEEQQVNHLAVLYDAKQKYNLDTLTEEQKLTNATIALANKKIEAEINKTKRKKKNQEQEQAINKAQSDSAFKAGVAAVEQAETFNQAVNNILSSMRKQIKGYIAEATAKVVADALKSVPFPFNILLATTAGAAASALFDKIIPDVPSNSEKVSQYAKGNYQVIGADDGKKYNAQYKGKATTGMVINPSLYLAGEKGPEMIIDYPTLQIPEVANMARIIEAIKYNRAVPQYATGNYPIISAVPTGKELDIDTLNQVASVMQRLTEQLDNGIYANISWDNIKDAQKQSSIVDKYGTYKK